MQHLLTVQDSDLFTDAPKANTGEFKLREAARAVVFDENNRVALLKAHTYDYHKLPGGGVEEGEDMSLALEREIMEEIGCEIDIIGEVGEIIEYRNKWQMKQISHCYYAVKKGEQQEPNFTESEIEDGFEVMWANDINHAISLLEHDEPSNYDGMFIQKRDITLLKAAKDIMEQKTDPASLR